VVCTVTKLVIMRYLSKNQKFVKTSHTFFRQTNNSNGVSIDSPLVFQEFYLMVYITSCSPLKVSRRFGGTLTCSRLQGATSQKIELFKTTAVVGWFFPVAPN
jgi:hypothetical protein